MIKAAKLVAPVLLLASGSAIAQDALAPHVHGEARLQVVLDEQELVINLNSPAYNLLGFEHAPQSAEEHALVSKLDNRMREPAFWIELPAAARCSLSRVTLGQHVEQWGHGEPHDHQQGLADHDHADAPSAHSEHRDLAYEYRFLCAYPEQFEQARVKLFEHFPALTSLHAEVIGASQSLQELNAGNPMLRMP
ncbi:ZrgA family zinc uptake protein [Marinobacterium sp. YM272]|uniref:ZrgA family zinc uptake protein n=1 Tax=Marinobacterium sp. YM272 TaxID=3421654 RepID=UPI003D7FA282